MANNASIKPLSELSLSDKELKHLTAAWLSCPNQDNIDIEKFAKIAGYPSLANARKRLGEVKKKVREQVFGTNSAPAANTPTTATSTTKKPAKMTPKRKTEGGDGESPSPSKKWKAARKGDAFVEDSASAGSLQAVLKEDVNSEY